MSWNKLALVSVAALAACDYTYENETTVPGFGSSVQMNHAVQVGYATSGVYFDELSRLFAAEVDEVINFDFNRSTLTPQARATLDQQAAWLQRNPVARLRVEGHTDLVGGENYNLELGLRRAESAVNYLVSRGVDRSRLDAVATFGETRPVVATPDRERLNRRAVTRVAGVAMGAGPGDFDGKRAVIVYDAYLNNATNEVTFSGGAGDSAGGSE
ncbi:OmpA family protein [Roseobacter sp. HKCCA0434]|uniref:OmpA family protein n=1 Tax=Roseobacter sp. HKCCA0434 TaxID=3079297 RepID=UPI002905F79C|nr:OmpA family protein [Roseobacter sp. HKCCA0434]